MKDLSHFGGIGSVIDGAGDRVRGGIIGSGGRGRYLTETLKEIGVDPQTLMNQVAYRNPPAVVFPRVDITGVQSLNSGNPKFTGDDIHSWFADFSRPMGNQAKQDY